MPTCLREHPPILSGLQEPTRAPAHHHVPFKFCGLLPQMCETKLAFVKCFPGPAREPEPRFTAFSVTNRCKLLNSRLRANTAGKYNGPSWGLRFKSAMRILAILLVFAATSAQAATLKSFNTKDGKVIVSIQGEITVGDNDSLRAAIKTANDAGKMVSGIRLDSIGGSLAEGLRLAETIKTAKVATNVASNATCASACFLIFAAGSEKFVNYTARVGVHGASDESGTETQGSRSATIGMARASKELGVSAGIIGKMVVTPPAEMVWLTVDDLKSMGVSMIGKPAQLTTPQPNAQSLPPMQLGSESKAVAKDSTPKWEDLLEAAIARSTRQNNGKPNFVRSCQPEFKTCGTAIFYKMDDGSSAFMRVTKDMREKTVGRHLCTVNKFGDIRKCLNWDTGETVNSMKNNSGDWVNVD